MSLFESGALGLASLILLAGTALAGAVSSIRLGELMAAAVAASLAGFLFSGVFDHVLGALGAVRRRRIQRPDNDAAADAQSGGAGSQPRSIRVPIRSAGQTKLTGALVSASKDGLLPLGKSTM